MKPPFVVVMRIGDGGSLRFGHERFKDYREGSGLEWEIKGSVRLRVEPPPMVAWVLRGHRGLFEKVSGVRAERKF